MDHAATRDLQRIRKCVGSCSASAEPQSKKIKTPKSASSFLLLSANTFSEFLRSRRDTVVLLASFFLFCTQRFAKYEGVERTGTRAEKDRSYSTQNNLLGRLNPKTTEEVQRTFQHSLPLDLFERRPRAFVRIHSLLAYLSAPALFCGSLEDAFEWSLRRGRARKERCCVSRCVDTCCKCHLASLYISSRSQP